MSIEPLQQAKPQEVNVYAPYYQGRKRTALPFAISLYQRGNFEGSRKIEGGESIPFVATWFVSLLPADITRCSIQFEGDSDLRYEVTMANFEFVDYLIDVIFTFKATHSADFSQAFYRKLLNMED